MAKRIIASSITPGNVLLECEKMMLGRSCDAARRVITVDSQKLQLNDELMPQQVLYALASGNRMIPARNDTGEEYSRPSFHANASLLCHNPMFDADNFAKSVLHGSRRVF
jgi:hypothetical protein